MDIITATFNTSCERVFFYTLDVRLSTRQVKRGRQHILCEEHVSTNDKIRNEAVKNHKLLLSSCFYALEKHTELRKIAFWNTEIDLGNKQHRNEDFNN